MNVDPLSPLPAPLESWRPTPSQHPRTRQEAEAVARELEAVFLSELLKSLEATLPSGSLLGQGGSQIRAGLVRDELARFLAEHGGIGLAEEILRSLDDLPESHPRAGKETGQGPEKV